MAPFVTFNADDIIFVSSGPVVGSGFFQNAGDTRRVGVEVGLNGNYGRFDWFANYAFVQATFEDELTILSENNPSANADGEIQVNKRDRLPGIPQHLAKLGVTYRMGGEDPIRLPGGRCWRRPASRPYERKAGRPH